jgi:RNA polymerase sigma factor (sigma-70 family)
MTARQQQDARHREAVRAYYETSQEALLGPVLTELRPRLLDFLRGKGLRAAERVEDLVQEALVEVLAGLRARRYTLAGSLASWAASISWHCFASAQRRKTNHITQPGAAEDPFLLLEGALVAPADSLPQRQEAEARASQVVAAVTHAVLALDPNARACVLLHYYQGLSEAQAAERLGIEERKFRERLRRGLTELRAWSTRHQYLAPEPEHYEALVHVDSGDLFQEPFCIAA